MTRIAVVVGALALVSASAWSRTVQLPPAAAQTIDIAAERFSFTPSEVKTTAGTTLTGAVDPIDALADVCAERGTWLHVDGAYGVAAASTTSRTTPPASVLWVSPVASALTTTG